MAVCPGLCLLAPPRERKTIENGIPLPKEGKWKQEIGEEIGEKLVNGGEGGLGL